MYKCKAINKNNKRCRKNAKDGSSYCGLAAHQKQADNPITVGSRGKKRSASDSDDELSAKRVRQDMTLKFINSGKESSSNLFRKEATDVISNVLSFLNSKEVFPLRLSHPSWTVVIDQNEALWSKLYTAEYGSAQPLHFCNYQEKLHELVPSFCDSMRRVFLKRSYANFVAEVNLLQVTKQRNCTSHFHFSKDQAKQILYENVDDMEDGWTSVHQMVRSMFIDDQTIYKYNVLNKWTGDTFQIYTYSMGDGNWVGKVHLNEQLKVYAYINDGSYDPKNMEDTHDEPDSEILSVLAEVQRDHYNSH